MYKNFAFISYSHRDMEVARWLQRKLEAYRLPVEVHNDIDAGSRYLRPVFRDQSDLNTGILSEELRRNLEESKFLLLLCSENSARSQWVSDEARAFVEMGRLDRIIPVIIPSAGVPEPELFPEYLREYFASHPGTELLGVNIGEVGRPKALVRVVSKMLGVSFDSLWKRHRRRQAVKVATYTATGIVAAVCAYLFALPVQVDVAITPEPSQLPTGEEILLTIDGADYTVALQSPELRGVSVPGYKRFGSIDISVSSQFFTPVDTTLATGFGLRREVELTLRRDDSFATFAGTVYDPDMNPVEGVSVSVGARTATTDAEGCFAIRLPLAEQRESQRIRLSHPDYTPITREDESPSATLKYILYPAK
ncbi:MAG: TIR domain-containing protein [Muribaculaceae bacterium]|nr:TIR domain-containing protein [Muribaculaceae bacterium]